jgi:hypothetical protein
MILGGLKGKMAPGDAHPYLALFYLVYIGQLCWFILFSGHLLDRCTMPDTEINATKWYNKSVLEETARTSRPLLEVVYGIGQ